MKKPHAATLLIVLFGFSGIVSLRADDRPRIGPGVNLTPLDPVTLDAAVRSSNGTTHARITFVNRSATPVDIYWISYEGNRVLYRSALPVGATWGVNTCLTHPWLVIASGTGTTEKGTGVLLTGFEALTPNGDVAIITSPSKQ